MIEKSQSKLPIMLKNRRLGGKPEIKLPNKGKGNDGISFRPETKPRTEPDVVFVWIVTL